MATLEGVSAGAEDGVAELVEPGSEGAIECQAPGCGNWFVKRSGRHIYCKAPDCTYRRGAPPEQELEAPEGAAAELLRRLQDPEGGGEIGLDMLGPRLRALAEANRRGDQDALYGALLDTGVVVVRTADRVRAGTLPVRARTPETGELRAVPNGSAPVGLVHAVLASHARTVTLAERRVEAVWELLRSREALEGAEAGVAQTTGTEQSVTADALMRVQQAAYAQAERALQAVEAAWAERRQALTELEGAGLSVGAAVRGSNGGARGRRAAG